MKDNPFVLTLFSMMFFFLTGVLPAMNFDDKIRMTVAQINKIDDLSIKNLKNQLQSDEFLSIHEDSSNIVLEFKKPKYIFLYSDKQAEKELKKLLPRQIYVKIA